MQKNPKGFAFLIPQKPGVPDAYLPREDATALLNDDLVEFSLRREGRRASARVHRIVQRGQQRLVGRLRAGNRDWWVESLDGDRFRVEGISSASRKHDYPPGTWVLARFLEYPDRDEAGIVEIEEVLGPRLLPRHDPLLAIARFNLESEFSGDTLRETLEGPRWARREIEGLGPRGRRDLRDLPFVTIDGADAKDFDDAVLVETPESGPAFVLYVAIADVSFFVRPGSEIDHEAQARSTSVYFPGSVIPMLPEALSNDLCSLRPREDKLAVVAEIHLDGEGNVEDAHFYEAAIRTAARLTYEQVQRFLEKDPTTRRQLNFLEDPLERAHALYKKLALGRKERGVLDFDLPECKMVLDESGIPISMGRAPRFDAHKLIEEFMIQANEVVARRLREERAPALYRVHEPPDPGSLDELNSLLKTMGFSKPVRELSPRAFARVLESTAELKGAATLHQFILRLQKQARYEPDPKGHFGLALSDYTHFTSPIRRYPDLVVHRALKYVIGAEPEEESREWQRELDDLGTKTSERERRAMQAERFVVKRKQCWFMEKRIGEIYDGVVTGIIGNGVFVQIPEMALEGFVPLEKLDGYYEHDERKMCLRKRPGHSVLAIGDALPIRVDSVSVEDNEITFVHRDFEDLEGKRPARRDREEREEDEGSPSRPWKSPRYDERPHDRSGRPAKGLNDRPASQRSRREQERETRGGKPSRGRSGRGRRHSSRRDKR